MAKNRKILLQIIGLCLSCLLVFGLLSLMLQEKTVPQQTLPATQPTLPPNLYGPEDFHYEEGYLVCSAADAVMGIDVSYHQEQIQWQQVKDAGVEFVMVRLGNRGTTTGQLYTDPLAQKNLADARAAGLKVGAYFYSQALSVEEAKEEAALALEILDGFQLDLPLAYDWEQESRTENMDSRTLTDCTLAFCKAVENAGYRPMVYFNSHQAQSLLVLEELTQFPWWLAMYDVTMEFPYRMDMWQYTQTGAVPGITGDVDINLLLTDLY